MQLRAIFISSFLALAAAPAWAEVDFEAVGPYAHENLSVFLLRSKSAPTLKKKYLTLAQALKEKKVKVHETGDVNTLAVENDSSEDVYLQAGDIVKGGRQDRTLGTDLILPRKSGKVPIAAFCVESGRWSQRRGENAQRFESSTAALATKSLKVAARKSKNQGEVWKEVEVTQAKLSKNVAAPVQSAVSASSLELSLENEKVKHTAEEYKKALVDVPAKVPDAIGFAFAINGQMNSAEVYGSPELFRSMWPKLLESSAIEALAERDQKATQAATVEDVKRLVSTPVTAPSAKKEKPAAKVSVTTNDTGKNTVFETRDDDSPEWVHRSYY
ncbi:MAG: DUF6569 family protein [Myxococcota bacterium]